MECSNSWFDFIALCLRMSQIWVSIPSRHSNSHYKKTVVSSTIPAHTEHNGHMRPASRSPFATHIERCVIHKLDIFSDTHMTFGTTSTCPVSASWLYHSPESLAQTWCTVNTVDGVECCERQWPRSSWFALYERLSPPPRLEYTWLSGEWEEQKRWSHRRRSWFHLRSR